ncbi:MAG TPA: DUF4245 domain-containing protein [Pseudolysinimonas sp.]|nr:DUF4245 domain-containing protein [Pseudolysinimonas sp.]
MSDRKPATHDEQGRPIVAELGRAETADEIAERKAAASAAHRNNQTVLNLVIALAASLLVVFLIVVVVVRPDQSGPAKVVDWVSVAKDAQPSVSTKLVVPQLPTSWSANRAELVDAASASDGIASWQIGFITPSTQYIGLVQGIKADATWASSQLQQKKPTGDATFGGFRWQVYDHRSDDHPGNLAYALVTTVRDSTVVLAGTASDSEFATLATEVSGELG